MGLPQVWGILFFGKLSKSIYPTKAEFRVHAPSEEPPSAAQHGKRREEGKKRQHGLRFVRTHN